MDTNEIKDELEKLYGCVISKVSIREISTLYIRKNEFDENFAYTIECKDILAFHDTGFIGNKISYVDVGRLGFVNATIARNRGEDPNSFYQIYFINKESSRKEELMIACRHLTVITEN